MIIGLAGKAGVGKDLAGSYLKLKQWKVHSFALPLKRVCAQFLSLPLEAMSIRELKDMRLENPIKLTEEDADTLMSYMPHPILGHEMANQIKSAVDGKEINSIRELQQFVGTDIGRNIIDSNIWIKIATEEIKNLSKKNNVVITDIRFENENDAILELGGITAEMQRDTELSDVTSHSSEDIDFKCTLTIDNNGSKQALFDKIEELLNDTKRERTSVKRQD